MMVNRSKILSLWCHRVSKGHDGSVISRCFTEGICSQGTNWFTSAVNSFSTWFNKWNKSSLSTVTKPTIYWTASCHSSSGSIRLKKWPLFHLRMALAAAALQDKETLRVHHSLTHGLRNNTITAHKLQSLKTWFNSPIWIYIINSKIILTTREWPALWPYLKSKSSQSLPRRSKPTKSLKRTTISSTLMAWTPHPLKH